MDGCHLAQEHAWAQMYILYTVSYLHVIYSLLLLSAVLVSIPAASTEPQKAKPTTPTLAEMFGVHLQASQLSGTRSIMPYSQTSALFCLAFVSSLSF